MIIHNRFGDYWLWICSKFNRFEVVGFETPLGPIIRSDIDLESLRGRRLIAHEYKHQEQMRRYKYIGYVFIYIRQWLKYGYDKMPLEIEAQEAANEVKA
jgi:hypothetical protein